MNKRRSDLAIMRKLIVLVKPLTGVMLTGIILGVLVIFMCNLSPYHSRGIRNPKGDFEPCPA